jgi:hypothetical protein
MKTQADKLQEFLAKALFGATWEQNKKFVVHRQGNLANAQQRYNSSAWFTYYTSMYEKKTVNPTTTDGIHTANVLFTLHLQCIGRRAEEFMLHTLFWDERTDIKQLLAELDCVLLETPRTIISTPYFQDGANTILAYETVFKISCALTLDVRETSSVWKEVELKGTLIVSP